MLPSPLYLLFSIFSLCRDVLIRLLVLLTVTACSSPSKESVLSILAVKSDSLWHFLDMGGGRVFGEVYDEARPFHEGLAAVCRDGKWGFVNLQGEMVIPL